MLGLTENQLEALGVVAHTCSTDHDLRYDITLRLDIFPAGVAVNGPLMDGGVCLGEAHVDGYTHRGCARRGGRPVGRL